MDIDDRLDDFWAAKFLKYRNSKTPLQELPGVLSSCHQHHADGQMNKFTCKCILGISLIHNAAAWAFRSVQSSGYLVRFLSLLQIVKGQLEDSGPTTGKDVGYIRNLKVPPDLALDGIISHR